MSVITTIRGGAVLMPASLETLRGAHSWPLVQGQWPADAPRLAGDDSTPAGPVRHFAESRLVADCVAAAFADAGLTRDDIAGPDTGFVSGSCYGCAEFLDSIREGLAQQGPRGVRATEFSIATHGYPMAALAMAYGAQGPATAFVGGTGSAVEALAFAELMLRLGFCSRMVVVGYDLPGKVARSHLAVARRLTAASCVVALVVEARPADSLPADLPVLTATVTPPAQAASDHRPPSPETLAAAPLLEVFAQLRGRPDTTPFSLEIVESCGSRTRLDIGPPAPSTVAQERRVPAGATTAPLELELAG